MADVVISYAPENEATARQLAEALAEQGYEIWRPDGGSGAASSDAVTEQIAGANAVVVVWSGAAAASDWVRAEANIARGMKKLVQASADGNPPPVPFDATQVASISTWLGEDDHPGWEAIRSVVTGLAGTPTPPETRPEPEPASPPPPPEPALPQTSSESLSDPAPSSPSDPAPAAVAAMPSAQARRRGPNLAVVMMILFVLIVLGGVGYIFWLRSQLPGEASAAETNAAAPVDAAGPDIPQDLPLQPGSEVSPPPTNETFDRQAVLRGSAPAPVRSAPTAQGFEVGRIQPGEAFQTYQQTGEWWRVRTASGGTGYVMASAIQLRDGGAPAPSATPGEPQSRRAEPRAPRQRIRKENAQVMEQYCAGAGSNTPQCRRFRNSVY